MTTSSDHAPVLTAVPLAAAARRRVDTVVISEFDALTACADPWRDLLTRSAADEPMLSPTWLLSWWKIFGAGRQLRVGMFFDDGRLIGISPFCLGPYWHRPGILFNRLQPLGADAERRDGVCSEYLNIICEHGSEARVAAAFVEALTQGRFGEWDEMVLPMIDSAGPMPLLLGDLLRAAKLDVQCSVIETSRHAPLAISWLEYLQQLGGRRRYYVKRALRDFAGWAGDDYTVHEASTLAELDDGMRILRALHAERWRAAGRRGVFEERRFRAFHELVMPQLLEEGRLQLLWLSVRGEPVAVLYNILANGKAYFYQAGRKMDVPDGQRPGIVLFAKAIQRAINAGLHEFDFLGGACQYKEKLASASRELLQIRAARRTLKEALRAATQRGIFWVKQKLCAPPPGPVGKD